MASAIRRKPLLTYKSPTPDDHVFIRSPSATTRPKDPTEEPSCIPSSSRLNSLPPVSQNASRRGYLMAPPLPLFHPFGALAMSLPPLDPTQYGLPIPSVPDERDYAFSQTARSSLPDARLRAVQDESQVVASSTVSAIAAVAARETKERASPKKRRAGGSKRKRKDAEETDLTYPAKRTRPSRGAVEQSVEDDSPPDVIPTGDVRAATPEGLMLSETNEVTKRRSTRAKGTSKRRDSSASETSGSALVGRTQPMKSDSNAVEKVAPKTELAVGNDDKEEGELSEDPLPS
ncbi:hypothetical protein D9613_000588 [Agrocybe pediades]|uniref:Uncharacterized protein n=1 Tax=Agrocybe pediades TaxID=84607 RepID=A0A8H4VS49_9AGAR|nr:hypothetical protein D9613_000588 [Agrocybe pediades]